MRSVLRVKTARLWDLMSRATPQMRNFAKRIITYDANGKKSAHTKPPDIFHACEKLASPLATLMGNGGFRALLSRSIALAGEEVSWLRAVHVKSDGSLEASEDLATQMDSNKLFEGRVVLLAQLLGLLVAFIGENLTVRLVREVWPKVLLNDLDLSEGNKNEKAK
jgi:hypothetical protein